MHKELTLTETLANEIEVAILADLTDRKGLRQAWEEIDKETQAEIEEKWIELIEEELKNRL